MTTLNTRAYNITVIGLLIWTITAASQTLDRRKLPLAFEPNVGQTDPAVKFLQRGKGSALFFTDSSTVLVQRKGTRPPSVLSINFGGANSTVRVSGAGELPAKSHYYLGADTRKWKTLVPVYTKLRYESMYPGIDVVFYGNEGHQMEFDFIIAPEASPDTIQLVFDGPSRLEVDDHGQLNLEMDGERIQLKRPVAYQEIGGVRQRVSARYVRLQSGAFGFELGAYDPARPLVIDPVLVYSTYFGGGGGNETGLGIAANPHGSAFVIGITDLPAFPAPGSKIGTGGSWDVFVTKLTASGSPVWTTFLGGTGDDGTYGNISYGSIAIDKQDRVYLAGVTTSADFPTKPLGSKFGPLGVIDMFVTRLTAAGLLDYSTMVGGAGFEGAHGIAVDAANRAYVVGLTNSDVTFPLKSAVQPTYGGGPYDAAVFVLNPAGTDLVYSTFIGGAGSDIGNAIDVNDVGMAFIAGTTNSTNLTVVNPLQPTYQGGETDGFITVIRAGGAPIQYSSYLGGSNLDGANAIAQSGDSIFVAGLTNSTNFPTKSAFQPALNGVPLDAFVTKIRFALPPASQLIYSTYLGGGGDELALGIDVDITGNAYVAGRSGGTFYASPGLPACTDPGGFVVKLNSSGLNLTWATCLSGAGKDGAFDVAVDAAGCTHVTGFASSSNFPIVSAFQPLFQGGPGIQPQDAFITKICDGVDHFKCYEITSAAGFQPVDVILRDQFESQVARVMRPVSLCNPVRKGIDGDYGPLVNFDSHLICYETRDSPATPPFSHQSVSVTNQFQQIDMSVSARQNLLCVPSLKREQ